LFYRSEKTVVNEIALQLISIENYRVLKEMINDIFPLHNSIIYSLPEALWVFCITVTSRKFYVTCYGRKFYCAIIPIIFCIGLELFQLFDITNGTFDAMDIIMSLAFWMIAQLSFRYDPEKQDILKPINVQRVFCFTTYAIVYLAHVSQ
jgi:hypothetical protein